MFEALPELTKSSAALVVKPGASPLPKIYLDLSNSLINSSSVSLVAIAKVSYVS